MGTTSQRLFLRDLSPATRLVIAAFLVAVTAGYFAALVQLHVQHAGPGEVLPGFGETEQLYHGKTGTTQLVRLLTASSDKVFNGGGTMAPAFTTESAGWKEVVREGREQQALLEREAERLALLDWIQTGMKRDAYDADDHSLSAAFPADKSVPEAYLVRGPGPSYLERVLTAPETLPFNGDGSMRPAFFKRSARWEALLKKAKGKEGALRSEREGEIAALLDWAGSGAKKKAYDDDDYLPTKMAADQPITEKYLVTDDNDKPVAPRRVHVKQLIEDRCVRCHGKNASGPAGKAPLDSYEDVAAYCTPEPGTGAPVSEQHVKIRTLIQDRCVRCHANDRAADERARNAPLDTYDHLAAYAQPEQAGGMPIRALAQTTHAHLLSFAMLFTLTGLLFSFTSFPLWVRAIFAPFTLVVQVAEIACWWLSRVHPFFSLLIIVLGTLVALGLCIHVAGTLYDLRFGKRSQPAAS
jgi:hypothetical protein